MYLSTAGGYAQFYSIVSDMHQVLTKYVIKIGIYM